MVKRGRPKLKFDLTPYWANRIYAKRNAVPGRNGRPSGIAVKLPDGRIAHLSIALLAHRVEVELQAGGLRRKATLKVLRHALARIGCESQAEYLLLQAERRIRDFRRKRPFEFL